MTLHAIVGVTQRIIVPNSRQDVQVMGYGPPGAKGDQGPEGPQGPAGPLVSLGELTDISVGGVTDNMLLTYDAGSGLWVASGTVRAQYIRIPVGAGQDASPTSTTHPFQIGQDDSANLIIDNNEIVARNNGSVSQLSLNFDGGAPINVGDAIVFYMGGAARASIVGSDVFGTKSLIIQADDVITIQGASVNIGSIVTVGGRALMPLGASTPGTITPATNFTAQVNDAKHVGPMVYMDVSITRTNSNLAATGTNTTVATVSSGSAARGNFNQSFPLQVFDISSWSLTANPRFVYNPSTGVISMTVLNETWVTGGVVRLAGLIPAMAS